MAMQEPRFIVAEQGSRKPGFNSNPISYTFFLGTAWRW